MSKSLGGAQKPELRELPTIKDRITFLYVERCLVNRRDSALAFEDSRGVALVPGAALGVLMLGPGSNVTHRAVELASDAGVCLIWVGEHGVRYYAGGRPLARTSRLVARQAELVSNVRSRIAVARLMYQMRFPDEDVSRLTMQQLRGREGARVRSVYRACSKEYGVPWKGRSYNPDAFEEGSPVNQALSAAHACLYGIAQCVIAAFGCSPALGFVHTGHDRSFVYDFADLYKADITIPIAFSVVAENPEDVGGETRRRVRDAFATGHILERMVHDLQWLLLPAEEEDGFAEAGVVRLWDDKGGDVAAGVSYD